ncbi:MAG: FAD-dependent oxidoreductase [Opitutales bacterium]
MVEGKERRRLVLVGAGHSHLPLLGDLGPFLRRGCGVTLIAPDGFWYSGMGPGVLSETYQSQDSFVDTASLVQRQGGESVCDVVRRIHFADRRVELGSGRSIPYDLLSVNVGSGVPVDAVEGAAEHGWTVKPIENLSRLRDAVRARAARGGCIRLVAAGGGAAGCEVVINLWHLVHRLGATAEMTLVVPGGGLLKAEGSAAGRRVRREMDRLGIEVRDGRVTAADARGVVLEDGDALAADFCVIATGVRPPTLFRESGLPVGGDGALLVNHQLQSVRAPEIFGAGDCITFGQAPPPRVGVYAVRESKVLRHNLLATLDGHRLSAFTPGKPYLLILNLGDGRGLLLWKGRAWGGGRWTFRLKHLLDRRFVERFR